MFVVVENRKGETVGNSVEQNPSLFLPSWVLCVALDGSFSDICLRAEGWRYVRIRIPSADLGGLESAGGIYRDPEDADSGVQRSSGKQLLEIDSKDVGIVPVEGVSVRGKE